MRERCRMRRIRRRMARFEVIDLRVIIRGSQVCPTSRNLLRTPHRGRTWKSAAPLSRVRSDLLIWLHRAIRVWIWFRGVRHTKWINSSSLSNWHSRPWGSRSITARPAVENTAAGSSIIRTSWCCHPFLETGRLWGLNLCRQLILRGAGMAIIVVICIVGIKCRMEAINPVSLAQAIPPPNSTITCRGQITVISSAKSADSFLK